MGGVANVDAIHGAQHWRAVIVRPSRGCRMLPYLVVRDLQRGIRLMPDVGGTQGYQRLLLICLRRRMALHGLPSKYLCGRR